MVSNGISSALISEQDLASIPTAQGGLSRLAIARLKSAGVPVEPLLSSTLAKNLPVHRAREMWNMGSFSTIS